MKPAGARPSYNPRVSWRPKLAEVHRAGAGRQSVTVPVPKLRPDRVVMTFLLYTFSQLLNSLMQQDHPLNGWAFCCP